MVLADDVTERRVDRGDAAVAGQLFNTVIRAISVELKVREVEELVGRLEALEEALENNERRGHYGTY